MAFLEIIEEQESFDFQVGDSILKLRRLDPEVYREIHKKHTKTHKHPRTGNIFKETDDFAVNADLLDYMIVGWSNVKSPSTGEDVPCNKENKNKLPGSVQVQIVEACDVNNVTGSDKKKRHRKS